MEICRYKIGDYVMDKDDDVCLISRVEDATHQEWATVVWRDARDNSFRFSSTRTTNFLRMATDAEIVIEKLHGNVLLTR